MIYRITQKDVDHYREYDAVSQSRLKLILKSVHLFNNTTEEDADKLYYSEKSHFVIGSAVDDFISFGEDEWDNHYYIGELAKKPSDTIMSIIKQLYDRRNQNTPDMSWEIDYLGEGMKDEWILDACIDNKYYSGTNSRMKDETKITKVVGEGNEYWTQLCCANGRQILSQKEKDLIFTIIENLITNKYTKKYFEEEDGVDIYYQLPIYWKYNDIWCKGLLDLCRVDHNKGLITPIDIKTLGDHTLNFMKSLQRRRYDFQGSFYMQGLHNSDFNKWGYKVDNFKFIVESTTNPGTPLVYTCTRGLYLVGKCGRPETTINGQRFRAIHGFQQAIELYKWYEENGYEEEKLISDRQGELDIDFNGII